MQELDYKDVVEKQRNFFATGKTLPVEFRIHQLKKLRKIIKDNEHEVMLALKKDMNKAAMEAFVSEFMLVIDELNLVIKKLQKWVRPVRVSTPFPFLTPGHSAVHYEPYGCVLIISSWNYPFILVMLPLIGAICAGNCIMIKPSEVATHTQELILRLLNNHFPAEYVAAINADVKQTQNILHEKFDYIFFTGGLRVGKIVMEAAAKHLTPVTLELGGKSPCIVDHSANLDFAARRIIWAKLMNVGQTCIAPDYLLVHHLYKEKLIKKLQKAITHFYGENPQKSASYGRIINRKQFARLKKLLLHGHIIYGGNTNADDLYFSPTLIDEIAWDDPIMQEEIFGPILPILTFETIEEVIEKIKARPKPLALYLFSNNAEIEEKILTDLSFGGGCINDCMLQIVNLYLPFGGVGASGIGFYHGKYSFEIFSHRKSIYKKTWPIDVNLQYPPYSENKLRWLKRLIKFANPF